MRQVELLIFREIGKADVASAKGEGNKDKTSGGGQQDLRFNPYTTFEPAFRKALSDPPRPHEGKQVFSGQVHWLDGSNEIVETVEFWPPTPSRPTMGRISKLPHLRFFDRMRADDFDDTSEYLFLLAKELDGPAWMFLLNREVIDNPAGWDPAVQEYIARSWAERTGGRKFVGYIDFVEGRRVLGGVDDE